MKALSVRRLSVAAAIVLLSALAPRESAAQFTAPCSTACAVTLGATGVVAATGAVVAFGRLEGGMSNTSQAIWTGGMSYVFVVGSGMALSGNGERQERAVYGAAIGSATGALLGLAFVSVGESAGEARRLAGALVGAAAGAILGGGLAITLSF